MLPQALNEKYYLSNQIPLALVANDV